MRLSNLLSVLAVVYTAMALPAPVNFSATSLNVRSGTTQVSSHYALFDKQQSCAEICGSVCYYQTTINKAIIEGYALYESGSQKGNYPHLFDNYEGFDFPVSGPYQEYPIMSSFQAYSGGSPGADRVIFNTRGQEAGVITHTGVSGNDFVECRG